MRFYTYNGERERERDLLKYVSFVMEEVIKRLEVGFCVEKRRQLPWLSNDWRCEESMASE